MSDVMKQVVQEVLKGNKTIVSSTPGRNSQQKHSNSKPTGRVGNRPQLSNINRPNYQRERSRTVGRTARTTSLSNIKRPNYQQLKQDQRLAVIKNGGNKRSIGRRPAQSTRGNRTSASVLPKQFNQDSVSKLASLTLAQGKVPKRSHSYSLSSKYGEEGAKIVGKTKSGACVWFFPNVTGELLGKFHRPLNNASVGVVQVPDCLPSYLLLINDVIRSNQDVKFYVSWDKEGKDPFVVELYDSDAKRLENIMNDIFQKINRRSLKQLETYTAKSPSAWLSKQLNISSTVDSIAFLEGIPYYSSIVLMDNMLRDYEKSDFDYEINNNYLLLIGNYHVVSKLILELKKEADRL